MTEKRRGRGTGNSPGGRDARRSARPDRGMSSGTSAERRRRAPSSRRDVEAPEGNRVTRLISRRTSKHDADKSERTILGLSTGRAVILALVVCALALTLAVPLRTYFTQRADSARVEAQRQDLESELQVLREKKQQQEDPAYINAEARDRLRWVMPGETPYQVQLPGAFEAEQARMAPKAPKGGPWYTDLWKQVSHPLPAAAAPTPPALPIAPPPPPPPPAGVPG